MKPFTNDEIAQVSEIVVVRLMEVHLDLTFQT